MGLTRRAGYSLWHSHRNCGVHFGTQCPAQPQTQRAVRRRTQSATERPSQAGTRFATRRAIHCRIERGVDVQTDGGPEFLSLGAIERRAQPRVRRGTERRAKSLNDGHIDGGGVLGLEPRGQSGSDSPPAGASLRHSPGLPGRARSGSTRILRVLCVRRQINT